MRQGQGRGGSRDSLLRHGRSRPLLNYYNNSDFNGILNPYQKGFNCIMPILNLLKKSSRVFYNFYDIERRLLTAKTKMAERHWQARNMWLKVGINECFWIDASSQVWSFNLSMIIIRSVQFIVTDSTLGTRYYKGSSWLSIRRHRLTAEELG